MQTLLPNYRVVTVDVSGDGVDLKASAQRLPLADSSFAVVMGLDLLEHVPSERRPLVLQEMSRVANTGVILAGPFDGPEVRRAETDAMRYYQHLSGKQHRWLAEHLDYGLPKLNETIRKLEDLGWITHTESSNPLHLWTGLQRLNFLVEQFGIPDVASVHEGLVDLYLDGGDADHPPYRTIVIAQRDPVSLSLRSAREDGLSTEQAISLIEDATARGLGSVVRMREDQEGQYRDRLSSLESSLQKTRHHNDQLQEKVSSLESDLSTAAHQSSDLYRRTKELESILQAARQQGDTLQGKLNASERLGREFEEAAAAKERRIQHLESRIQRASTLIEADVTRIERSAAWRIGRAVLAPARWLRRTPPTGPERIRTQVLALRAQEVSPGPEQSQAGGIESVKRDLAHVLRSRRLKIGNALGAIARFGRRSSHLRPDIQLADLARALDDPSDVSSLTRTLELVLTHSKRLERSRRWRFGQAIGSAIRMGQRRGDPALPRLQKMLSHLLEQVRHQQQVPHQQTVHNWGLSAKADAGERQRVYSQYLAAVEPLTIERLSAHPPVSTYALIMPPDPTIALHVVRRALDATIASLEQAGVDFTILNSLDTGSVETSPPESWKNAVITSGANYVLLLRPGDLVARHIASALASKEAEQPDAVVFDHDYLDFDGARVEPRFKPAFSPDFLLEVDYVGRAMAITPDVLIRHLPAANQTEPTRDVLLRMHEESKRISKIDGILLHVMQRLDPTPSSSVAVTANALERRGARAAVNSLGEGAHVTHETPVDATVSIIIPFKDRADLLRTCVESLLKLSTWPEYEILLVDNKSEEADTIGLIDRLTEHPRIRVIEFPRAFNYPAANNNAAAEAAGAYLLFLNNDTQVLTADWIEELVGYAAQPGVGAVGAKLLYPNGRIQHAGVVVGMPGLAGHLFAGVHEVTVDPYYTSYARNTSAVTSACLAISREAFERVGGFDEQFTLAGADVDLCLRLLRAGYRNVINPAAQLIHVERVSRAHIRVKPSDRALSLQRYEPMLSEGDPYYNSELSLESNRRLPSTRSRDSRPAERSTQQRTPSAEAGFVQRYDASSEDLRRNAEVIARSQAEHPIALERVTWFVPRFDHVHRGGINTILRVADAFSRHAGAKNQIVIDGANESELRHIEAQLQSNFPDLQFQLLGLAEGSTPRDLPFSDAAFATLWTTAYHLLRYNQTKKKLYLVQDFEPLFRSAGAAYGLAEQTYRLGFDGIANTRGVAERYRSYGNRTLAFTPGVDRSIFHPGTDGRTTDAIRIVFYGRPNNVRNGFELGVEALARIKRLFGDRVEIRSVGADFGAAEYGLDDVLINLGVLPDLESVAQLYRTSDIGLVFMFTAHPSYQPLEYMASGCATVTNLNEANSWLLENEVNALCVPPTVSAVVEALSRLITDEEARKQIVAAGLKTVESLEWEPQLRNIVEWTRTGEEVL